MDVVENTPRTLPKGSRDIRSLRVLRNFLLHMRTSKGTPKGSSDLWYPCYYPKKTRGKTRACAEPTSGQGLFWCPTIIAFYYYGCCTTSGCGYPHPTEHLRGQISVTSGSHVTTTKKKTLGKTGHAQNLLPVRATSGRRHFRTVHMTDVTSGHMTSGCSSSLLRKCGFAVGDILLTIHVFL